MQMVIRRLCGVELDEGLRSIGESIIQAAPKQASIQMLHQKTLQAHSIIAGSMTIAHFSARAPCL